MNRRILAVCVLLVAMLGFSFGAQAQYVSFTQAAGQQARHNGGAVTGGFVYGQGTSGTQGTGTWTVQSNACGATFSTTCSIKVLPTTAGSDMAVGMVTGPSSTGHITSAYSCVSSNPCLNSSGDLVDTFSLCSASSCLVTNSGLDHDDVAYVAGGAGGAGVITMNLSATPSSFEYEEFGEIVPPLCGASVCASSVDNSGNGSSTFLTSGSCGGCVGPAFTQTGTDGIIEIIDSVSVINSPSSAYTLDWVGNVFAFDDTSGAAITFQTNQPWTLTGLAFKTAGGAYSPPAKPFSNLAPGSPNNFTTASQACTPTCPSITLPVTVNTAGALIIIFGQATPGSTQTTIASVTDNKGNTYTVPTGANTCQQTGGSVDLTCAYSIITTTGVTTLTPVMNTSTTEYFMYYLVSASSGTIALDTQNSSHSSTASQIVTGQTLSLSGGSSGVVDACFAETGWATATPLIWITSLYASPQGSNFFGGFSANNTQGGSMVSLNQRNGNPPKMYLSASTASQESSGICFHN